MKTLSKSVLALAALAGLAGCAKEQSAAPATPDSNPDNAQVSLTLTAGQENAGTRAAIDAAESKVIDWTAGDKLSVFDGGNKNCSFILTAGEGTSTGTFSGFVTKTSDEGYAAIYPYQDGASWDGSTVSGVTLKYEQTAVAGSFDPEAALMCARSTTADGQLEFKNIVGYVKFTTDFACKKITLMSNSTADVLAGTVAVTPGDEPAAALTLGASHKVSLSAENAGEDIAAGTYYIALLPGTLENGFKLVFTDSEGKETYRGTSKALEITRNNVTNLGDITSSVLKTYPYITLSADGMQNFKMTLPENPTAAASVGPFEYSTDGGATWTTVTASMDYVAFGDDTKILLRGKSANGTAIPDDDGKVDPAYCCHVAFSVEDVYVSCTGDIRTLIDYEAYSTTSTANARFYELFEEDPDTWGEGYGVLCSAPELPATELASRCYSCMFLGNDGLTSAPVLPATELSELCYQMMFCNTSLKVAPELPAKKLAERCYQSMFSGTYITVAPELPATELADGCYSMMFSYTGISSVVLPAATLVSGCYEYMFTGCTKLTDITIKAVKATETLEDGEESDLYAFDEWLDFAAANGTIHKRASLTLATDSISGIPSGWTAVNDVTD